MARKKKTLDAPASTAEVMQRTGATAEDAAAAMEILKPVENGITTSDLQAAGIDMRLTKADILELISAQLRDQLGNQVQAAMREEVYAGLKYMEMFEATARRYLPIVEGIEKTLGIDGVVTLSSRDHYSQLFVFGPDTVDTELKRQQVTVQFNAPGRLVSRVMVDNDLLNYNACNQSTHGHTTYQGVGAGVASPHRYADPQMHLRRFVKVEPHVPAPMAWIQFSSTDALRKDEKLLEVYASYKTTFSRLKELINNYNNLDQVDRQARYALVNKILSASKPGKRVLSFFDGFRQGTMENVSKLLAAATGPQK